MAERYLVHDISHKSLDFVFTSAFNFQIAAPSIHGCTACDHSARPNLDNSLLKSVS